MRAFFITVCLLIVAAPYGCGEEGACEEGSFDCSDDMTELLECIDGTLEVAEECPDGLECHAEMGHCMAPGDDDDM